MTVLDYTIFATSRLSPGAGPELVNARTVHQVVPGSTVRGALAAAWVAQHGFDWQDPRVRTIFESSVWFGQARPEGAKLQGISEVTCKYEERGEGCRKSGYDVALRVASGEPLVARCPSCGGSWDRGRGWHFSDLKIVSSTRTALVHGVAKNSELFTRRALEKGTILRGKVRIDASLDHEALTWLQDEQQVRIGGQRSVLGEALWSAVRQPESPRRPAARPTRVVLRCQSPTIVTADHGGATLDPQTALRRALGEGVTIVADWVRPIQVSGWHMASGLPKPDEWAIGPGSTFVIEGAPADLDTLLVHGIGLRRHEGYGDVVVVEQPEEPTRAPVTSPRGQAATDSLIRLAERVNFGVAPEPEIVQVEEPKSELTPAELRSRTVADVVAAIELLPPPSRRAAVQGLVGGITRVRLIRENGFPESNAQMAVGDVLGLPWVRSLPVSVAQLIKRLLSEPDVAVLAETRSLVNTAAKKGLS